MENFPRFVKAGETPEKTVINRRGRLAKEKGRQRIAGLE
jgi:hypothetical protein